MTRSPCSIIAKSAIALADLAMQALLELGDLDRELAARRGVAPMGRRSAAAAAWRKRKARPRFLQCGGARGPERQQCIGGSRATDRRGHRPRRRLAAVRPLHGARALRAGARLLRERAAASFGRMPAVGSDFVTAPELSPLFGRALARQVAQALEASGSDEVWEFGAGSRRARGRSCSAALGDARPPLHDRRAVGAACASASAKRLARVRATASAGSTRCPSR